MQRSIAIGSGKLSRSLTGNVTFTPELGDKGRDHRLSVSTDSESVGRLVTGLDRAWDEFMSRSELFSNVAVIYMRETL